MSANAAADGWHQRARIWGPGTAPDVSTTAIHRSSLSHRAVFRLAVTTVAAAVAAAAAAAALTIKVLKQRRKEKGAKEGGRKKMKGANWLQLPAIFFFIYPPDSHIFSLLFAPRLSVITRTLCVWASLAFSFSHSNYHFVFPLSTHQPPYFFVFFCASSVSPWRVTSFTFIVHCLSYQQATGSAEDMIPFVGSRRCVGLHLRPLRVFPHFPGTQRNY